jgi:hypothetical protein
MNQAIMLGNCDLDTILTKEQKAKGLWLCRANSNHSIINIIYLGSAVFSLRESHTDREARAAAEMFIEENKL